MNNSKSILWAQPMPNWLRLNFGIVLFFVFFAYAIVLNQTMHVYLFGSVPTSGLILSGLINTLLLLLLLALIINWCKRHPLLIWLAR